MLKIPIEDIISKIRQSTNLSYEEVNKKIDAKLEELSGLISREGAAHIIANELGVKLFEQVSGKLAIKNIVSGMRNVETLGKVIRVFELRQFKTETREGKVASMVIGDETGTIRITLWGNQADNIAKVKEGDIVKVMGGYVKENLGNNEVHLNDRSKLIVNPEGETVNVILSQARPSAIRKTIVDLTEPAENIEVLGTIVQAFDPKFFEVCKDCGKRLKPEGDKYFCSSHGYVLPDYSYVMNVILDDGTETIRCTFFRNQAERLLGKTKEEILYYKDNPGFFESVKTDLLGNIVKLVGRVNKNEMFDRMEFLSQLVFTNPNPEEEIKRLQSEKPKETPKEAAVKQQEETITEEIGKID